MSVFGTVTLLCKACSPPCMPAEMRRVNDWISGGLIIRSPESVFTPNECSVFIIFEIGILENMKTAEPSMEVQ